MSDEAATPAELVTLAAEIVGAYVTKNAVRPGEIAGLIASVHEALANLAKPQPAEPERPVPPVPINKPITPDHLISLEDGKRYRALKRHLRTRGMTPEQYRTKWGLPPTYPMVAPNYAKLRSEYARQAGLGSRRTEAPAPKAAAKRGRKARA